MIKKLQVKSNTDIGEVFQTVVLGRHGSCEIKHFYLQENMYDFGCQWRDDERNCKNMPASHNKDVINGRSQYVERDAGKKPIGNRLALSFHDELHIFKSEQKIDEFNQADKSINSSPSFSPCQEISPPVPTTICNIHGGDFMHPLILTQDRKPRGKDLTNVMSLGQLFIVGHTSIDIT